MGSIKWLNDQVINFSNKAIEAEGGKWKKVNESILFNWKLNMDKLICEVLETKADVITFQEVDTFIAKGEYNLEKRMAELGYAGVHRPKPGNGNGLFGYVDGPAIFWDNNKYERVDGFDKVITFAGKAPKKDKPEDPVTNPKFKDKEDKHIEKYQAAQIAIVTKLMNRYTKKTFYVVSGHMKSGGGDPKQMETMIKAMEELNNDYEKEKAKNNVMCGILCGIDMNATKTD